MENISLLRSEGISVGLAIDHDTEVEAVFPYLEHVDYVLVMTIRAGFSFQDFIPEDLDKVRAIKDRNPNLEVMIDGGVDDQTAKLAAQAGVDSLAVASYVIGKEDIRERIRFLQSR